MLSYPPVYVAPPIWQQKFSRGWAAIIGVLQMFVTCGILLCETLSMLTSIEYAFLFIGYGASWWFIITWISVYGSLCCSNRCCTTYTLFMQIICFLVSIVLIVYDALFLGNLYKCFYPAQLCADFAFSSSLWDISSSLFSESWTLDFHGNVFQIEKYKKPLLYGQLAGAVLMLLLSLGYMLLYIVTAFKLKRAIQPYSGVQPPMVLQELGPQQRNNFPLSPPTMAIPRSEQQHVRPTTAVSTAYELEVECHQCHHMVQVPQPTKRRY